MAMGFSKPEEQTGSKNHWIQRTHDALDDIEIHRTVDVPDELSDCDPFDPDPCVVEYNRLIQRLARRVGSKKTALGAKMVDDGAMDADQSLWCETVDTVQIPPSGKTVDVGVANVHGEVDLEDAFGQVDWVKKPVRLSNLRWWAEEQITIKVKYIKKGSGPQADIIRKSLYLPVHACDSVVDQLIECMDDLGWTPDAAEKDLHSEPLSPGGIDNQ